jgi:membrane protein DedA with SNARE-associated domain
VFHFLQSLLAHNGYWVIFLVVFLNNVGFPVPGDAMLLGGGFLVGKEILTLWIVAATGTAACFLGGSGGYWLGSRYGRRYLQEIKWFRLNPAQVESMDRFFAKHGPKVVFFARFVALLHPVTGLMAGMWKTPWRPFLLYNLAGSAGYALIYTLVGLFFGQRWERFESWLGPVAFYVFIVAVALLLLSLFLRRSIRSFFDGFSKNKKNGS